MNRPYANYGDMVEGKIEAPKTVTPAPVMFKAKTVVAKERAKLLGIVDDTDTCECCGKRGLKRVAVIEMPDGRIVRYGTTCASYALGNYIKNEIETVASLKAYITRWQAKYTGDIVAKGIREKLGMCAEYKDGQYHVAGKWVI